MSAATGAHMLLVTLRLIASSLQLSNLASDLKSDIDFTQQYG